MLSESTKRIYLTIPYYIKIRLYGWKCDSGLLLEMSFLYIEFEKSYLYKKKLL